MYSIFTFEHLKILLQDCKPSMFLLYSMDPSNTHWFSVLTGNKANIQSYIDRKGIVWHIAVGSEFSFSLKSEYDLFEVISSQSKQDDVRLCGLILWEEEVYFCWERKFATWL